jgi:hypothetical protein
MYSEGLDVQSDREESLIPNPHIVEIEGHLVFEIDSKVQRLAALTRPLSQALSIFWR